VRLNLLSYLLITTAALNETEMRNIEQAMQCEKIDNYGSRQ